MSQNNAAARLFSTLAHPRQESATKKRTPTSSTWPSSQQLQQPQQLQQQQQLQQLQQPQQLQQQQLQQQQLQQQQLQQPQGNGYNHSNSNNSQVQHSNSLPYHEPNNDEGSEVSLNNDDYNNDDFNGHTDGLFSNKNTLNNSPDVNCTLNTNNDSVLTSNDNMVLNNNNNNNVNNDDNDDKKEYSPERPIQQDDIDDFKYHNSDEDDSIVNEFGIYSFLNNSLRSPANLKMYQQLKDLENKDIKLSIPVMLFFGYQSSGKTSIVSALAQTPIGTIKNGTATRCPVEYTMRNNPELTTPKYFVNKQEVENLEAQIHAILNHMEKLENSRKFSTIALEIDVEGADILDLVFVDMPGLIMNDEMSEWKRELENITKQYLSKKSKDGSFAYIPIYVTAAKDIQNDNNTEIQNINRLLSSTRPNWRDDAIFVINKFDINANFPNADETIDYIKNLTKYNKKIHITTCNPNNDITAQMPLKELQKFYDNVSNMEQEWWDKTILRLKNNGDKNVEYLEKLKANYCGIPLLRNKVMNKMCEIVQNIIPNIEKYFTSNENEIRKELTKKNFEYQKISKPDQIKKEVDEFITKFLRNIAIFYSGREDYEKKGKTTIVGLTWFEEINLFLNNFGSKYDNNNIIYQKYLSQNGTLKNLFNQTRYSEEMDLKLVGMASLDRFINYWKAMICCLKFPDYSIQKIKNSKHPYHSTLQSNEWETARNMVLKASSDIQDGAEFFCDYLQWKFKYDSDMVFQYTFNGSYQNNKNIQKLLQIGLNDYKKKIDEEINKFHDHSCHIPKNLAENLDKNFANNTMNLWLLVQSYLPEITKSYGLDKSNKDSLQFQKPINGDSNNKPLSNERNNMKEIYDIDCYEKYFICPPSIHFIDNNNNNQFVCLLSRLYWKIIKIKFIDQIIAMFGDYLMTPISETSIFDAPMRYGIDILKKQNLIDQLSALCGISGLEIDKILQSNNNNNDLMLLNKPVIDMKDEQILKLYGCDKKQKEKELEDLKKQLNDIRERKEKADLIIENFKNDCMKYKKI